MEPNESARGAPEGKSILKRRQRHPLQEVAELRQHDSDDECTGPRFSASSRRVSFAVSEVKEFEKDTETTTVWGNSYFYDIQKSSESEHTDSSEVEKSAEATLPDSVGLGNKENGKSIQNSLDLVKFVKGLDGNVNDNQGEKDDIVTGMKLHGGSSTEGKLFLSVINNLNSSDEMDDTVDDMSLTFPHGCISTKQMAEKMDETCDGKLLLNSGYERWSKEPECTKETKCTVSSSEGRSSASADNRTVAYSKKEMDDLSVVRTSPTVAWGRILGNNTCVLREEPSTVSDCFTDSVSCTYSVGGIISVDNEYFSQQGKYGKNKHSNFSVQRLKAESTGVGVPNEEKTVNPYDMEIELGEISEKLMMASTAAVEGASSSGFIGESKSEIEEMNPVVGEKTVSKKHEDLATAVRALKDIVLCDEDTLNVTSGNTQKYNPADKGLQFDQSKGRIERNLQLPPFEGKHERKKHCYSLEQEMRAESTGISGGSEEKRLKTEDVEIGELKEMTKKPMKILTTSVDRGSCSGLIKEKESGIEEMNPVVREKIVSNEPEDVATAVGVLKDVSCDKKPLNVTLGNTDSDKGQWLDQIKGRVERKLIFSPFDRKYERKKHCFTLEQEMRAESTEIGGPSEEKRLKTDDMEIGELKEIIEKPMKMLTTSVDRRSCSGLIEEKESGIEEMNPVVGEEAVSNVLEDVATAVRVLKDVLCNENPLNATPGNTQKYNPTDTGPRFDQSKGRVERNLHFPPFEGKHERMKHCYSLEQEMRAESTGISGGSEEKRLKTEDVEIGKLKEMTKKPMKILTTSVDRGSCSSLMQEKESGIEEMKTIGKEKMVSNKPKFLAIAVGVLNEVILHDDNPLNVSPGNTEKCSPADKGLLSDQLKSCTEKNLICREEIYTMEGQRSSRILLHVKRYYADGVLIKIEREILECYDGQKYFLRVFSKPPPNMDKTQNKDNVPLKAVSGQNGADAAEAADAAENQVSVCSVVNESQCDKSDQGVSDMDDDQSDVNMTIEDIKTSFKSMSTNSNCKEPDKADEKSGLEVRTGEHCASEHSSALTGSEETQSRQLNLMRRNDVKFQDSVLMWISEQQKRKECIWRFKMHPNGSRVYFLFMGYNVIFTVDFNSTLEAVQNVTFSTRIASLEKKDGNGYHIYVEKLLRRKVQLIKSELKEILKMQKDIPKFVTYLANFMKFFEDFQLACLYVQMFSRLVIVDNCWKLHVVRALKGIELIINIDVSVWTGGRLYPENLDVTVVHGDVSPRAVKHLTRASGSGPVVLWNYMTLLQEYFDMLDSITV